MKHFFSKILFVALVAVFGTALTGCNPEPEMKQFSVSFQGYGPGYITCHVTLPSPTTVAYTVSEEPLTWLTPTNLNMMGTRTTFYTEGVHQLLDFPVEENKKYHVYLVGLLGEKFSKMYEYEFETGEFEFSQLATVIGVAPDGYKMHIKVPPTVKKSEEGKPGSRAIRYTQGDLMIYNFYKSQNDDYFNLLYNAGRYVTEDTVIEYSDKLNEGEAGADVNEDGVVDGNDISMLWNPIAPGEPVVFIAGEFEWMSEPDEYKTGGSKANKTYSKNGFSFPGGWADGYYLPCIDGVRYWAHYGKDITKQDDEDETEDASQEEQPATRGAGIITNIDLTAPTDPFWNEGSFQRKLFRTRIPAKLDADFEVRIDDLMSVNATLTITPDEEIFRYLFTVLDDGSYKQLLELLDNKDEYLQWAVTSYFAMYNFGQVQVVAETGMTSAPAVTFDLTDYFYEVPSETKYHVLITGMSGEIGSPQCFKHYTFSTPAKTKTRGPNVVVTAYPEDECEPYTARFNVKCTSTADNPVVKCYYGANYLTDWVYSVNQGSSYETLGKTVEFTAEEIKKINSSAGLDMSIPTIDHETTRLVVVAYNDENISNGIDLYEDALDHPAVDDCTTPYAVAKTIEENPLLDDGVLTGDWTLTATLKGGAEVKQKVHIRDMFVEGVDYPSELPDSVLKVYRDSTEWTDPEIFGYFEQFKTLSKEYNKGRLRNQNKLLLEGWLDDSQGSLTYLSPWDLFKHKEISTVDVPSMFARFGPKIYIHVNKDKQGRDSLSVTANKMFVSPVADWSVPFYLAGRAADNSTVFQYSDNDGNYVGALEFPVTLSEDRQTITIHPLETGEGESKVEWYPNVIGVSTAMNTTSYILETPIESAVVLTKGWTGSEGAAAQPANARASRFRSSRANVVPVGKTDFVKYHSMTDFKGIVPPKKINVEIMTLEKVHENFEKFRKEQAKRIR